MSQFKISLLVFTLLFNLPCFAGDDLIFISGFDLTQSELNCPEAQQLVVMTNEFGGLYLNGIGGIELPGDKKFFSVNLDSGEWYHFKVTTDSGHILHPVISLFDEFGTTLVAQNASPTFRDALFSYHNLFAGQYCIKVEDYTTFSGQDPRGGAFFNFEVLVTPIDFSLYDDFNLDVEPNDSVAEAQLSVSFSGDSSTNILGILDSENDKDVYKITTDANYGYLKIVVKPVGSIGNGSSSDLMEINVIDTNQIDILARVEPQLGVRSIYLPVESESDYYIEVSQPVSATSNNPFYVLDVLNETSIRQEEINEVANDDWSGSEIAINNPLGISPAPPFNYYFIAGELSGISDQDWWQFEVNHYDEVSVECQSAHSGSGVIDAKFELFSNPEGSAIQAEVENVLTGVVWSNDSNATMPAIPVGSEDDFYLKISADIFSNEVVGRHYRCYIAAY